MKKIFFSCLARTVELKDFIYLLGVIMAFLLFRSEPNGAKVIESRLTNSQCYARRAYIENKRPVTCPEFPGFIGLLSLPAMILSRGT